MKVEVGEIKIYAEPGRPRIVVLNFVKKLRVREKKKKKLRVSVFLCWAHHCILIWGSKIQDEFWALFWLRSCLPEDVQCCLGLFKL